MSRIARCGYVSAVVFPFEALTLTAVPFRSRVTAASTAHHILVTGHDHVLTLHLSNRLRTVEKSLCFREPLTRMLSVVQEFAPLTPNPHAVVQESATPHP